MHTYTLKPKWNVGHRCELAQHTSIQLLLFFVVAFYPNEIYDNSAKCLPPFRCLAPSRSICCSIQMSKLYFILYAIIAQHHIVLSSLCFTISSGLGPYQMLLLLVLLRFLLLGLSILVAFIYSVLKFDE